MINKNLFLQDIKQCSTVLQELEVCKKYIMNMIGTEQDIVLWENENPNDDVEPQNITIEDIGKYNYIVFGIRLNSDNAVQYTIVKRDINKYVNITYHDGSNNVFHRYFQIVNNTRIAILNASENGDINNSVMIPIIILGTNKL